MTVITAFLLRFRLSFLLSTSRFVTHTALVSEIMQFYGRGGCYWPSAQGSRTRRSHLDWSVPFDMFGTSDLTRSTKLQPTEL